MIMHHYNIHEPCTKTPQNKNKQKQTDVGPWCRYFLKFWIATWNVCELKTHTCKSVHKLNLEYLKITIKLHKFVYFFTVDIFNFEYWEISKSRKKPLCQCPCYPLPPPKQKAEPLPKLFSLNTNSSTTFFHLSLL